MVESHPEVWYGSAWIRTDSRALRWYYEPIHGWNHSSRSIEDSYSVAAELKRSAQEKIKSKGSKLGRCRGNFHYDRWRRAISTSAKIQSFRRQCLMWPTGVACNYHGFDGNPCHHARLVLCMHPSATPALRIPSGTHRLLGGTHDAESGLNIGAREFGMSCCIFPVNWYLTAQYCYMEVAGSIRWMPCNSKHVVVARLKCVIFTESTVRSWHGIAFCWQ